MAALATRASLSLKRHYPRTWTEIGKDWYAICRIQLVSFNKAEEQVDEILAHEPFERTARWETREAPETYPFTT